MWLEPRDSITTSSVLTTKQRFGHNISIYLVLICFYTPFNQWQFSKPYSVFFITRVQACFSIQKIATNNLKSHNIMLMNQNNFLGYFS